MTQDLEKKTRNFLKERILRFKLVAVIRKNIFLFSFLSIFVLTILIGVWDIKKYEIYDLNGNDLQENVYYEIQEYVQENIFKQNFFRFLPSVTSKDMYLEIAKLKSVRMEKVMPNKVVLFVEIYEPKYSAFLKNESCNILSSDGIVLDTVCEELEKECCKEYSVENNLIYFTSTDVEVSVFDYEKNRLLIMEEIGKVVRVVDAFQYNIKTIDLKNDILEVVDQEDTLFRFTIADDIDIQLKRFIVVVAKVRTEYIKMSSLDLRFERPVLLE
jgi:hypothetical protein